MHKFGGGFAPPPTPIPRPRNRDIRSSRVAGYFLVILFGGNMLLNGTRYGYHVLSAVVVLASWYVMEKRGNPPFRLPSFASVVQVIVWEAALISFLFCFSLVMTMFVLYLLPGGFAAEDVMTIVAENKPYDFPTPSILPGGTLWQRLFVIAFCIPLMEEFFFRGYLLQAFRPFGERFAVVMTSLLFASLHPVGTNIVFAFLFGFISASYVVRSGSLLPGVLGHMLGNAASTMGTLLVNPDFLPSVMEKDGAVSGIAVLVGIAVLFLAGCIICWQLRRLWRSLADYDEPRGLSLFDLRRIALAPPLLIFYVMAALSLSATIYIFVVTPLRMLSLL